MFCYCIYSVKQCVPVSMLSITTSITQTLRNSRKLHRSGSIIINVDYCFVHSFCCRWFPYLCPYIFHPHNLLFPHTSAVQKTEMKQMTFIRNVCQHSFFALHNWLLSRTVNWISDNLLLYIKLSLFRYKCTNVLYKQEQYGV